jgi:hypothetical protein
MYINTNCYVTKKSYIIKVNVHVNCNTDCYVTTKPGVVKGNKNTRGQTLEHLVLQVLPTCTHLYSVTGWVKYERNERRCFSCDQASKLLGIVKNRLDLQYPTFLLP